MAGEQTRKAPDAAQQAVARAFGSENRARLLARYFSEAGAVNTANAWQHIYRLLLWIDKTTALAHCYESDKAQPGRPWYARSLAFHDWVSRSLDVSPSDLGENIDWLFREAIKDLASKALAIRTELYEEQRVPYEGRGFPEPGQDSETREHREGDFGQMDEARAARGRLPYSDATALRLHDAGK